jgi:hypothetical protein
MIYDKVVEGIIREGTDEETDSFYIDQYDSLLEYIKQMLRHYVAKGSSAQVALTMIKLSIEQDLAGGKRGIREKERTDNPERLRLSKIVRKIYRSIARLDWFTSAEINVAMDRVIEVMRESGYKITKMDRVYANTSDDVRAGSKDFLDNL